MAKKCIEAADECLKMLKLLEDGSEYDISEFRNKIRDLSNLSCSVQNGNSLDTLSDLVENELTLMDKAIEEAALKIQVRFLLLKVTKKYIYILLRKYAKIGWYKWYFNVEFFDAMLAR